MFASRVVLEHLQQNHPKGLNKKFLDSASLHPNTDLQNGNSPPLFFGWGGGIAEPSKKAEFEKSEILQKRGNMP